MKIAVTGATGQLGRIVVNKLIEMGGSHEIVAVVRDEKKAAPLADKGVEIRIAEYGDPAALQTAFLGVDKVLLISSNEVGQRIDQHLNVINAAKAANVEYIVYTSAPKATTSALILAPEHKATEENILKSGLKYTILRNNWYTENYVKHVAAARETGTVVAAVGKGRVASASRTDFAEAAAVVLLNSGHEGKTYELGGDYAWDYNELADAIGDVIGKPVSYKTVEVETLINNMRSAGMDEGMIGFVSTLDKNISEGALAEVTGELSKIIKRPTTPLKQGLKDAIS